MRNFSLKIDKNFVHKIDPRSIDLLIGSDLGVVQLKWHLGSSGPFHIGVLSVSLSVSLSQSSLFLSLSVSLSLSRKLQKMSLKSTIKLARFFQKLAMLPNFLSNDPVFSRVYKKYGIEVADYINKAFVVNNHLNRICAYQINYPCLTLSWTL
jgi:hypothetical protein